MLLLAGQAQAVQVLMPRCQLKCTDPAGKSSQASPAVEEPLMADAVPMKDTLSPSGSLAACGTMLREWPAANAFSNSWTRVACSMQKNVRRRQCPEAYAASQACGNPKRQVLLCKHRPSHHVHIHASGARNCTMQKCKSHAAIAHLALGGGELGLQQAQQIVLGCQGGLVLAGSSLWAAQPSR